MGNILAGFYDKAKEKSGLNGQIKLAMLTCMSLTKAQEAPDSPENIRLFEEALKKLG